MLSGDGSFFQMDDINRMARILVDIVGIFMVNRWAMISLPIQ